MPDLTELITRAEQEHQLTKSEIAGLLASTDDPKPLFQAADRVRAAYVGNDVHLRGLIEFSNICKRTCLYCGLRCANSKIKRYRLEPDTILAFAAKAKELGYRTLVLQSGEDDYYTSDKMLYIIEGIKRLDVALTLSIGEKKRSEYAAYKQAGADRYLLRIETTDKELYERLDPGMSYDNRLRCLYDLKDLGYEVGTGSLLGLPGQSMEAIAADILFFKELDADMIGVGPFIPNPDTPLAQATGGTFRLAQKVVAITRLLMPDINIPATTAMETLAPNGRILTLQRGANVVMPNVTEGEYRRLYALYPGKICVNDTPDECFGCISGRIRAIGRTVGTDYGFRKRNKNNPIQYGNFLTCDPTNFQQENAN